MKLALLFSVILICLMACEHGSAHYDIVIKGGIVYTGENEESELMDIGIKDDRIAYVGRANAKKIGAHVIIEAKGLIVCPGFIDPHTHADRDLIKPEKAHNDPFLMQGITTVIVGNDGDSFYPHRDYKKRYNNQGVGTNVVPLIGHATIRKEVIGDSDRKATALEIRDMQQLIQQEMDAGAYGISTGLFYAPGSYADTEEVIELSKTVSSRGGVYDTHLRDEGSFSIGLLASIKEAIRIGEEADIPIHISHIKCLGADVWGQSQDVIALIEEGQKRGVDITANQYPYEASATGLQAAVVPRWAESGGQDSLFLRYKNLKVKSTLLEVTRENIKRRGGPDKLLLVKSEDSTLVGKTLLEVADIMKLPPEETVYQILQTGYIRVASFNMKEEDIHRFMTQDWVVTGSDGNTGHPRKYGSFPRKYDKYVRTDKLIDLGFFIRNSSMKTAEIFNIENRGAIKENYYADIIVFDPHLFKDVANYKESFELSEGLRYAIINGKMSVEKGVRTYDLNGRILSLSN